MDAHAALSYLFNMAKKKPALDVADVKELKLLKGDVLIRQGDHTQNIYIVKSGRLRVFMDDDEGFEKDLAILEQNQLFGEMAFLGEGQRSASVQAIEDSDVLELESKRFLQHVQNQPQWFRIVIENLLGHLRSANTKVRS